MIHGAGGHWNPDNFRPCQTPPWGEVAAVNVNTGEIARKVPFGIDSIIAFALP
jgi:glucose dehydrogenase